MPTTLSVVVSMMGCGDDIPPPENCSEVVQQEECYLCTLENGGDKVCYKAEDFSGECVLISEDSCEAMT